MSDTQPTLACDLGALTGDERARRSILASRVAARFQRGSGTRGWLRRPSRFGPGDRAGRSRLAASGAPLLSVPASGAFLRAVQWRRLVSVSRRPRGQGVSSCGRSQGLSSQNPAVMPPTGLPSAPVPPNHAVERTAGSHSLAAAAHRDR